MATILAAARTEAGTPGGLVPRWTVCVGALAGALSAAVGIAVLSAVTVLLWAAGPQTAGRSADPFRTAGALWVLGQRGAVDFPGTTVRIAPLGLAAVLALVAIRSAGWASRTARAHDLSAAARVVGGFVLGVCSGALLVARLTEHHSVHVGLWSALVAVVPFALACAVVGVAPQTYEWAQFAAPRRRRWAPVVRAATAAGLVLLAGGAVVVAASLFARLGATSDLFDATGGGLGGALGLLLLCVVLLPTAACWAVAFAAGPGFAMGTDASVTLAGVQVGAVPALPIAGALPGAGGVPWYGWLPPVLVILAGVVAGRVECASTLRLRSKLARATATAGLTGLFATAVLAFSAGDAGGRLETLGPGWSVGPVLAGELMLVAIATMTIRHAVGPRPEVVAATVPTQRTGTDPVSDVLADDLLRFAGIPSDQEDLEDTQEIPIIRLPLLEDPDAVAGQPEPAQPEEPPATDGGRLRARWARAKARLDAEAAEAEAEEITPEAAEAMSVAQARYSADLTLTDG